MTLLRIGCIAALCYSRRAPSATAWFARRQVLRWIVGSSGVVVVFVGVLLWRRRKGTV